MSNGGVRDITVSIKAQFTSCTITSVLRSLGEKVIKRFRYDL